MLCSSCCFGCDFAVVDPGEVPPLFLDQTEKKFFGDCPLPLSKGLDDPPPPLSQGLDPALLCAKFIKYIVMFLSRNGDSGQ